MAHCCKSLSRARHRHTLTGDFSVVAEDAVVGLAWNEATLEQLLREDRATRPLHRRAVRLDQPRVLRPYTHTLSTETHTTLSAVAQCAVKHYCTMPSCEKEKGLCRILLRNSELLVVIGNRKSRKRKKKAQKQRTHSQQNVLCFLNISYDTRTDLINESVHSEELERGTRNEERTGLEDDLLAAGADALEVHERARVPPVAAAHHERVARLHRAERGVRPES